VKGLLITLEGVDACGKSTQMSLVKKWLTSIDIPHVLTREPGGVPQADIVRSLLSRSGNQWSSMGQALLLNAARVEHTVAFITPNLSAGRHVICDRYFDSTLAYQGQGDPERVEKLLMIHKMAVGNVIPDLTLWLDVDAERLNTRLQRRAQQGEVHDFEKKKNLQELARKGYQYLHQQFPDRIKRIEADMSVAEVSYIIQKYIMQYLGL